MKRRYLREAWQNYIRLIPEANTPEAKDAFYSGGAVLYTIINRKVSPGEEITNDDMKLMEAIDTELRVFGRRFDQTHLLRIVPTVGGKH